MKVLCVIPARYASSRLPGKPLADIAGKPMIQRVYEQASKATRPQETVVATDNELVFAAVKAFGGNVVMTDVNHQSGTDRLAEVATKYPDVDVIVNVQGDEPLIPPTIIDLLVEAFDTDPDIAMATLKCLMDEDEYSNPAAVKVVTDINNNALYFSRSQIPYIRNQISGMNIYKHIGIYAYKREFLMNFAAMQPSMLELTESLEQLRALENGYKIKVLPVEYQGVGVDTAEDLARVNEIFKQQLRR